MTSTAQSGEAAFWLINTLAATSSAGGLSGNYSNTTNEVWYLFGYPDAAKQSFDGTVPAAVSNANGSIQFVTVYTQQKFTGLLQQNGVWVLARIPTLVETNGGLALDPNLVLDGYLRLAYNVTANYTATTRFQHVLRLQIFDLAGTLLFDDAPNPRVPLISPIGEYNPNGYTPNSVHFDGSTGLVTTDTLATNDTGIISFAGWFNIDPSATGQIEFSQGSGSNTIALDTSIPPGTWFHMMGTIDGAVRRATLIINGDLASPLNATSVGSFGSAPTNGKQFYIGTDTQGNFFTGDIADLSIWFDTSFIFSGGGIPGKIIAKFVDVSRSAGGVTTIAPKHPALGIFGSNITRQAYRWDQDQVSEIVEQVIPDIFLAGPADKLYGHTPILPNLDIRIQELMDMQTYTGTLTNAGTAPGQIVIVPT